jgi:1,4-dihydroxy-2-naphthoate octaprenyltransferase
LVLRALDVVKGFLAEVRPLPMSLLLLTTLLGGFFARGASIDWGIMGLVLLNAFCFLYVAHLNDTFWDLVKGEYEEGRRLHSVRLEDGYYLPRWGFGYEIPNAPILPRSYYAMGMLAFSALGLFIMFYLSNLLGWQYAALAIVGLFLALTYSAGVDKIPALGDTWWEVGVLFALFCGYYSQALRIDEFIITTAVPLFVSLVGVKALDSLPDTIVDHRNNKVTLTVFLYRRGLSLRAIRHVCYVPLYVAFVVLFFGLPSNMKLGALACIVAFLVQQLALGDDDGRKSIVVAGFTILAFIVVALLVIAGLVSLPSL